MLVLYQKQERKGFLPSLLDRPSLDFSKPGEQEHLVFQERVWGKKNGEEFIFNPEQYGISKFFDDMDFDLPLMSDTVINYYSSGRREVLPAKVPYLIGIGLSFCDSKDKFYGVKIVSMEDMLTMFHKDKNLQMLNEKYPYLRYNGRFSVDLKTGSYNLEMPFAYGASYCGSVRKVSSQAEFSTLGNLQRFFANYVKILKNGVSNGNRDDYAAVEKWMKENGINASAGSYNTAFCRVIAGYNNLPYNLVEITLLRRKKDLTQLREVFIKHRGLLGLSYGLNVYSAKELNDYKKFDAKIGCPTSGDFIFEPEVFCSWGEEFSPAELSTICRDRYFWYVNPDMDAEKQKQLIKNAKNKVNFMSYLSKLKELW